jgi:hypothetical protein
MRLNIQIIAITIILGVLSNQHAVAQKSLAECKSANDHRIDLIKSACGANYFNQTPEQIESMKKWAKNGGECDLSSISEKLKTDFENLKTDLECERIQWESGNGCEDCETSYHDAFCEIPEGCEPGTIFPGWDDSDIDTKYLTE